MTLPLPSSPPPAVAATAPRRFPVWLIGVIGVAGLASLAACAILVIGVLSLLGQRVEASTVITAVDGQSRVTVPGGWRELNDLHDDAELQAGDRGQNQYVVVLTEDKADLDMDLATYADTVLNGLAGDIEDARVSEPRSLTINGRSAVQYEVRGTVNGIKVVYWMTDVEGTRNFFQVLGWTAQSKAEQNGPALQTIVESFEEVVQ